MLSGRAVVPRGLVTVLERKQSIMIQMFGDVMVKPITMYADLKIKLIEQEEEDEKSGGGGDQT